MADEEGQLQDELIRTSSNLVELHFFPPQPRYHNGCNSAIQILYTSSRFTPGCPYIARLPTANMHTGMERTIPAYLGRWAGAAWPGLAYSYSYEYRYRESASGLLLIGHFSLQYGQL